MKSRERNGGLIQAGVVPEEIKEEKVMDEFFSFLGRNAPLIAGAILAYFALKALGGVFGKLGTHLGPTVSALAILGAVVVVGIVVIAVFAPSVFDSFFENSYNEGRIEVGLKNQILNPKADPSRWASGPARAAAESVETGYQVKTAKGKTQITQARAEAACYLPKGHPDRAVWDSVWLDPCGASTPAGIQATTKAVDKAVSSVDWEMVNTTVRTPLVEKPPVESSGWVRDISTLPAGIAGWIVAMISILVVGMFARLVFR